MQINIQSDTSPESEKPQKEVVGHDEIDCSSCNTPLLNVILIEEEQQSEPIYVVAKCVCGDTSWVHKYPKNGYRVAPVDGLIVLDVEENDDNIMFTLTKE